MRQVFTSARIENVEGVARLLENAGIEVRITHGRSYHGAIRGNFSYHESTRTKRGPEPAVWIIRSEDQPRARQMLREAGLLQSTRQAQGSYLPDTLRSRRSNGDSDSRRPRTLRLKLGLLAVIAVAIGVAFLGLRDRPTPAASQAGSTAVAATSAQSFVIATPPALAETLLRIELEAQTPTLACLGIDGQTPPADVLARLKAPGWTVAALTDCPKGHDARYDVRGYRTDGSGIGTVALDLQHIGEAGEQRETRILQVQRRGDAWHVLRLLEGGPG